MFTFSESESSLQMNSVGYLSNGLPRLQSYSIGDNRVTTSSSARVDYIILKCHSYNSMYSKLS